MGENDPTTNQIDYDFDTAGVTFGIDYRFTDAFVAGMALGYSDTDVSIGRGDGDLDTTGYSVSLYGTWFKSDKLYLGGSIGYAFNTGYIAHQPVHYVPAPQHVVHPVCRNPSHYRHRGHHGHKHYKKRHGGHYH